jgi:DNA-binding XRE family transcriptional regulator
VPRRSAPDRSHGPSEIWTRPAIKRAVERARKRLGLRLRKIREDKGLTQEEAAERAGVHAKHLSVIETASPAAKSVSFATLVALAFAYEISLAVFFEDTPTIR